MSNAFEQALIANCAPTLAGHKCGSLFCLRGGNCADDIASANALLGDKGVSVVALKVCQSACLIYVYRRKMLAQRLNDTAVKAFLSENGYFELDIPALLDRLSERIVCCDDFPHEIGVFLDYPLSDVIAFIRQRGAGYRCLGCWKAYSDEQGAMKRFALYRKCRDVYMACYQKGFGVSRLTIAA